jgi:acylphosphatase
MFTQDAANNLGLTGWVRNDSDGSVECEAQGMTPELDQLLENLQQGPCFSNVEKVEFHEQPIVLGESHFHIRR